MRKLLTLFPLASLILCLCGSAFPQNDCSSYNIAKLGPYYWTTAADSIEHSSGYHKMDQYTGGACSYTAVFGPCPAHATAYSNSIVEETGTITLIGRVHETAVSDVAGSADATSPTPASASSSGAGAVASCIGSCAFTLTYSAVGGTVGTSRTPIWGPQTHNYTNTCPLHTAQKPCTNCCTVPPGGDQSVCGPSPILVDTTNEGWFLSDPNAEGGYVTFDFGGTLKKVSWPDWRHENAWLVYDKSGVIDSADDLFGNYTAHSGADYLGVKDHPDPNGFLALNYYDMPAQGGNGDGVLDAHDKIWHKLKLWKPKHCHLEPDKQCTALDSELFTLESQGVHAISGVYGPGEDSDWVWFPDKQADQCRFKTIVNPAAGETQKKSQDGRWACDFNLAVRK